MLPVPEDKFFNVGELKMVQVYRRGYMSSMWTSRETYLDFCVDSIQLAIENLVVNKIIAYSLGVIEKDYLLFKTNNLVEYVTYDAALSADREFGYLEFNLLNFILLNPDDTMENHIASLLELMLPNARYNNPGKEILKIILANNKLKYWTWNESGKWFWKKYDIFISAMNENNMVNDLNRISAKVGGERRDNRDFRDFSSRLRNYISSKLRAKKPSDDPG